MRIRSIASLGIPLVVLGACAQPPRVAPRGPRSRPGGSTWRSGGSRPMVPGKWSWTPATATLPRLARRPRSR